MFVISHWSDLEHLRGHFFDQEPTIIEADWPSNKVNRRELEVMLDYLVRPANAPNAQIVNDR